MSLVVICFQCGTRIEAGIAGIGRRDECPQCHADVHVCRNCRHYDAHAYNECVEPSAEVVREKTRANFCDYFMPRESSGAKSTGALSGKDDLLRAAEALFKKPTKG